MRKPVVIFLDDGPWRLATWDGDSPTVSLIETPTGMSVEQRVADLCEVLHQQGQLGCPVLLAVPTTWCAAASILTDGLPRKDRHTAMSYRLEEKLPIAAEQFSAGFIHGDREALGVCVILDEVTQIIQSLEDRAIFIHAIIPTAMLMAQDLVLERQNAESDVLVWHHDGWCDTITLSEDHRRPVSWSLLPDDSKALSLHLNMMAIRGRETPGVSLMGQGADTCIERSDCLSDIDNVNHITGDPYHAAARHAGRILAGQTEPWIDLMGNQLASAGRALLIHKPMKLALTACVLMLVCINAAFLWRTQQHQNTAEAYREQERILYNDLYPGQTPPLSINMRLAGEYRKISGMRGKSDSLPPPPATLSLLHRVLDRLPKDVHFRVLEVRIEDNDVYIDGQARSHGDVGSIAKALGTGSNLKVETRHTEQLSSGQGVSFVIIASIKSTKPTVTMR